MEAGNKEKRDKDQIMKSKTVFLLAAIFLLVSSNAYAALTTIGTASYQDNDYNLIWDDDNNGKSIVWLDYSKPTTQWDNQVDWAAGLNSPYVLTYTIYDGYTVSWGGGWRLPDVGANPGSGCDGAGMGSDQKTSELGHLFFVDLGMSSLTTHTDEQINAAGAFENLVAFDYWYGNEFANDTRFAWKFELSGGAQNATWKSGWAYGMAVRGADVDVSAVPLPAAVWLLGSGLLGVAGIRRRSR